jgi:hypothetical protein
MTGEEYFGRAVFPVEEIAKPLMTTQVDGVERHTDALACQAEIRRAVREV